MIEETLQGQETFKIQLLAHHFDTILSLLPIDNYEQNSVMYNYYRAQGWHDGKRECNRIQEFNDQLITLDGFVPIELIEGFNAIIQICSSALQNGNKLFIVLD